MHEIASPSIVPADQPAGFRQVSDGMFAELQRCTRDLTATREQRDAALTRAKRAEDEAAELRRLLRVRVERLRPIRFFVEGESSYTKLRRAYKDGEIDGEQSAGGKNIKLYQTAVTCWRERNGYAPFGYTPTARELEDYAARKVMRDRRIA
jgi:hypothetical protein